MLSNREPVPFSFWPLEGDVSLWSGPVVLAALFLGFLLGLLFHLPHRFAAHRRAKRAEKRAAELEARLAAPPPQAP